MILNRPPMGWNSWNTFASKISEELIIEVIDKMSELGFLDAGYEYVVIDDCWSLKERDENGKLVADPRKFPRGMKFLADYAHSKGFKFGMYSCAGTKTCAGYPGSYNYEFTDAATFAEWGVDYLKYDYCYQAPDTEGELLYRRMGLALANCGRDIVFSACSWGKDNTHEWIKTTGAHLWRSTYDIVDTFTSVKDLILQQDALQKTNGHGCFNDMDMLTIGMYGQGFVGKEGNTMSDEEYITQFSAWCIMGSPLMIGCDVRNMSDETVKIYTNKEAIAINQDLAYRQVFRIENDLENKDCRVYARFLDGGGIAIGVFNLGDTDHKIGFNIDRLGLYGDVSKALILRDLWSGASETVYDKIIEKDIKAHCSKLYRAELVDINGAL